MLEDSGTAILDTLAIYIFSVKPLVGYFAYIVVCHNVAAVLKGIPSSASRVYSQIFVVA